MSDSKVFLWLIGALLVLLLVVPCAGVYIEESTARAAKQMTAEAVAGIEPSPEVTLRQAMEKTKEIAREIRSTDDTITLMESSGLDTTSVVAYRAYLVKKLEAYAPQLEGK